MNIVKAMRLAIIWGSVLLPCYCFSQLNVYPFEEAEKLQQTGKKNMVIFIHTDWCNYCNAMKETTLKNKKLAELLNNDFYFFTLNAEDKNDINFNTNLYHYTPNGLQTGVHELVEKLASQSSKKLSYPSLFILSPANEILFYQDGYMNSKELSIILVNKKTIR